MNYNNKWSDRRTSASSFKPFLFLMLEAFALLMICWIVSSFDVLFMTVTVSVGAMYLFMRTSIPRFNKVIKRQKFSQYDYLT